MDKPEVVAALERKGGYNLAHRIGYCKKRVFRMKCRHWFETGKPEHNSELRLPFTCHAPCCPDCSKIYGEKKAKDYLSQLESFELPRGYFYQFGTLTKRVRFSSDGRRQVPLREDLVAFFKQARVFMNEFFPRRERVEKKCGKRCKKDHLHLSRPVFQSTYCGAIAVLEVGKGWNVHLHCLAVGPMYSHSSMSQRWMELTGDSYIVEFEPVRRLLYREGKKNNIEVALHEVLKYIHKPMMYDSYEMTAEMLLLFQNFRRIHTFGVFYNPRTTGGVLEGFPKVKNQNLTCSECGKTFLFYAFDDENLWWDEKTYKQFYARDG